MTECPNCSGENAETQRFCGMCGTPLPGRLPPDPGHGRDSRPGPAPDTGAGPTLSYDEAAGGFRPPPPGLPSGTVFANRYQVIEELGMGGMGRVYRVLDKKLDEEIALKLIRPDVTADRRVLEHFSSELKLARHVVHRNVARMFDLNEEGREPYITMEYVRGENLRRLIRKVGCLDDAQAVPIACQLCEGLAEAHRLGIIHRDLKPQNVMIDEDGRAKIMDFGLASLLAPGGRDDSGSGGGTPAYVSPEQIRGLPVDGRSDLYALGVVMYEMLTGRTPFRAANIEALLEMQLGEAPLDPRGHNPAIPAGLSGIVMKCLEKDPARRFQSATEVLDALEALRATAPVKVFKAWVLRRKLPLAGAAAVLAALFGLLAYEWMQPHPLPLTSTIAVLPEPGDPADPLAAGRAIDLQSALSTKLGGVANLVVVPPLTVNATDLSGMDTARIGRELEADYLLRPSVRLDGERISLAASLINARRNRPSRTYELARSAGELLAVEDEFAGGVVKVIRRDIAEDRLEKSNKGVSSDLDARLFVHDAMTLIEDVYPNDRSPETFAAAVHKYEQALAIDPEYALALWALGNAYEARYNNTRVELRDPRDVDAMCRYYYQAYAKNWNSPETNVGLGWAHFNRGDFPRAFEFFSRALRLEPRGAVVNLDAGAFLRSVGLYRQAIRRFARAARLAPQDANPHTQMAQCLMALGRFDEAADRSGRGVALDPNDIRARHIHAIHLCLAGKTAEAEKEIASLRGMSPESRYLRMTEALIAAASGDRDKALALMGETEALPMYGTVFYLLLGMPGEAVANIERGIARGFETNGDYLYSYPSLDGNPALRSLRGLPRFREILQSQKERYRRELKPYEDI
jgi:Flp pilus assembly protein TadD/TolB-like protein